MRNAHLYALFVLLFGAALYLAVTQTTPQEVWTKLFSPSYKYTESENGIIFASNDAPIAEVLTYVSQQNSFILSPVGLSTPGSLNGVMGQSIVQQQIVFGGHSKLVRTVIRVYDKPNGKWVGCQTDYGTSQNSEFISVEECEPLLTSPNSITIYVPFPDASLAQPLVLFTPSSVTINTVKEEDIPGVTFLFLRGLYSDAEQLIGIANEIVVKANEQNQADANKSK